MRTVITLVCLLRAVSVAGLAGLVAESASVCGKEFQLRTPAVEQAEELIRGIVKERTEEELVVTEATDETKEDRVRLTKRTKYYKEDGEEGNATDVIIGAQVTVQVRHQPDVKAEAIEVRVLRSKVRD